VPLIIPPGFLQAHYVLSLVGDAELMITTCGHELDSASGANVDDAANDLFAAFSTTIMDNVNAGYRLEYVACYIGQDAADPLVTISDATPVEGAATGAPLPPNCAQLIRKRTDLGGRRGRGRMYIPGLEEGVVDGVGNITTPAQAIFQADADEWMDKLTTAIGARLYPPVVLHRSEGIGAEPPPTPIVSFVVERKIATQRRRLRP